MRALHLDAVERGDEAGGELTVVGLCSCHFCVPLGAVGKARTAAPA